MCLGHGPALRVLIASVTTLALACGSEEKPAPADVTPLMLGTTRAPLITNTSLEAIGDTYVRQLVPDENEGALDTLSVQINGRHRTLLFFDTPAMVAAVDGGTVLSARIEMFIASNGGSWGTGRAIAIHALRQPSAENAATWSCALDTDISNDQPDCSGEGAWTMLSANNAALPYASSLTSTAVIGNGTLGVVSFDVTSDVQAILAGTQPGYGWLIKKVDEFSSGSVRFTSREQGIAPRLSLMIEAPNLCTPTSSVDVSCDGVDDDCDGDLDEDYAPSDTTCGLGACAAAGVQTCESGQIVDSCSPGTPAESDATCDGVDEDCDGAADDDFIAVATACGVGACEAEGTTSCADGVVVDTCSAGTPAQDDATCDGADDDCDGAQDEEFEPGCAGQSTVTCMAGELVFTSCSDGDACNGEEACAGLAECASGTPPTVDDRDPCTIDACAAATGVSHVLAPAGTACAPYSACDDVGQCKSLLPPDPGAVAPALIGGAVSFGDRVRFLYEGEPRIQTGVTAGAILERSAAALRGRVLGPDGSPLPQVTVSVAGHPEYGQTLSRMDGAYDLAVNGGGPLTVRFERADVLQVERTIPVAWQDYTLLDDVGLTAPDAAVTSVALPNASAVLHQASPSSDARGIRSARVYVPAGTTASLRLADGSLAPATQLSLRASELGVGPNARHALPALLPESVASAYAVSISADEAVAQGAARVELSRPAAVYVEDFAGLPAGTALPVGVYERESSTWIARPNGRVLALLGVNAGLAELDADGSGSPASAEALSVLGIDAEERTLLASTFAAGELFFRLPMTELGAFDVGLPFRTEEGSGGVDPGAPAQLAPLDDPTLPPATAEGAALAASLPLAGTGLTLEYRSNRVLGAKHHRKISIPATGADIASGLVGGIVDVRIAGQRHTFSVPPEAGQFIDFTWDGLDAAGRTLHGWQRADIRVGLVSPETYTAPEALERAFAHTSFAGAGLGSAPEPYVRWLRYDRQLHAFDSRQTDIGGWAIAEHHQYDPKSRVVYLGDGSSYPTRTDSTIIERFAGYVQNRSVGTHGGDGGAALQAGLDSPRSVAVGPDGSVFIATRRGVRRVDGSTGIITTVAGGKNVLSCADLDEGPAADLCVFARTVDIGRDGALYISDNSTASGTYDRLRRLDLSTGHLTTIAGVRPTSGCANMGDGGPAREAALCQLIAHASAPDGSIYLLDTGNAANPRAIRKISTDGSIETIGTATWFANDDPAAVAVGPDGSVYVAQNRSVLRWLPTGEMRRFAGDPAGTGNSGEGGPALLARFGNGGPSGVSVGPDGRVYVGDNGNAQIRMVDQLGVIRRVAGSGGGAASGDGGSPLSALLGSGVVRSAIGPDGSMFITSRANNTIRVVRPRLAGDFAGEALVPSPDGTKLFRFAADGRHLETQTAATGAVEQSFEYDSAGRLIGVIDAAGNVTLIDRDEAGNPLRIVAPLGEETLLDTDAEGYLSAIVTPDGQETTLEYTADGLLTRRLDASGEHVHAYDADGRLIEH